ncbi:hypothetical protein [Sorangium sp. So ce1182]|uniref:hypothetical protein n=1 Tax=Sorangium sp. So ce1182 TaxID=3133334 RepID=UPI003F61391C
MASRTKGTRGGGPSPAADVDDEVDDLYKKPLGDFTRARDELAKRLRQAGDKAASDRVKALRRPTAAAWTLNQLARRYPQRMEALLDAGERLREAQRGALAPGGAQELREAGQKHRAIVNELLRAAPALFSEGGYSEKGNPMDRLRDSLLATPTASASDLELLARGRVSGDIEPGDLSDMLGLLRGRPSARPADGETKADRGQKAPRAEAPKKKAREAGDAPEKQRRAAEPREQEAQRAAKEREQAAQRSAKEREQQRSAKEREQQRSAKEREQQRSAKEREQQRSAKEREQQRSAKEREQQRSAKEREQQRSAKEREQKARLKAEEREQKAQLAAERRARKERLATEQREQKAQLAAAEKERDQASREAARAAKEADRLTKEAARMSRAAENAEEAARAARKRAAEAERRAADAQQEAADSAGRLDAAEDRLDRLGR